MRVAIINSVYGFGSTGSMSRNLNRWFHERGWESTSYFGRLGNAGDPYAIPVGSKVSFYAHALGARITGYEGAFSARATRNLVAHLEGGRPDAVILLNIHGYYLNRPLFFDWLAKTRTPVLYIMPDEYPFLGKCAFSGDCNFYQAGCGNCPKVGDYPRSLFADRSREIFNEKKRNYGKLSRIIFAAPEFGLEKARLSPLTQGGELEILDWGVDTDDEFTLHEMATVREDLGLPPDKKVVFALGPQDNSRKGIGEFFYPAARSNPDVLFVHIGAPVENPTQEGNMLRVPYIKDPKALSKWCSAADCLLFLSRQEMQPLAVLSTLASGTPVACFPASGMPCMLEGCTTYWMPEATVTGVGETVSRIPRKTSAVARECREYAVKRYSNQVFCKKAEDLCRRLVTKR